MKIPFSRLNETMDFKSIVVCYIAHMAGLQAFATQFTAHFASRFLYSGILDDPARLVAIHHFPLC